MTDTDRNGGTQDAASQSSQNAGGPQPGAQGKTPSFRTVSQYVKDFSFENPNAPQSIGQQLPGGGIKLQINVNGRQLNDASYEVELSVEARAGNDDTVVFNLELVYAGVFQVENVAKEQIHPLVMIEGPRLLFPFARQILADATRAGGFPPLLLDPIDFAALYRQRVAQMQASGGNQQPSASQPQ